MVVCEEPEIVTRPLSGSSVCVAAPSVIPSVPPVTFTMSGPDVPFTSRWFVPPVALMLTG